LDFRISFWSDRALRLSPAWTALNTRFYSRNKFFWNFFQLRFFHSSLAFMLWLTIICIRLCFLYTLRQLRLILPECKGLHLSSGLPRVRLPLDLTSVFIRSILSIDCPFRCSQFNCWNPLLLPLFRADAAGLCSLPCEILCSSEVRPLFLVLRLPSPKSLF
jgi:hypothetical protein